MDMRDSLDADVLNDFWWFVAERQNVWHRMVVEQAEPPWTDDEILDGYYFTNVYRELDPGTQYVIQKVLEREEESRQDRLFNVLLYRLIGRKESHAYVGFQRVSAYDPDVFAELLQERKEQGESVFTGAYMVAGYSQMGSDDKVENVARLFEHVAERMDETWEQVEAADELRGVYRALRELPGYGNFLAYQVCVDLLYELDCTGGDPFIPFTQDDWAQAGPGAKKGINLLQDQNVDNLELMRWLQATQEQGFAEAGVEFAHIRGRDGEKKPVSLANIQNCLCEYHKYCKIQENPRRARRTFHPGKAELEALRELYWNAPNVEFGT